MQFVAYYPADNNSLTLCESVREAVSSIIAPDSYTLEHVSHCSDAIYITILKASSKKDACIAHILAALLESCPAGTPITTVRADDYAYEAKKEGKPHLLPVLLAYDH